MTTLRIIFRRLRTLLWTSFSILVIAAAVGVGVGNLLMPYSEHYQPKLEQWLSQEFGRPVKLGSFQGEWRAFGPRLTLNDMRLLPTEAGSGEPETEGGVAISSAALDMRPLNYLIPGRPLYNFRVIGADFTLTRNADGEFTLSGMGVSKRSTDDEPSGFMELARVGEVLLEDSSLQYIDELHQVRIGLSQINGRLRMDGERLSTEVQAKLTDARNDFSFGDLDATLLLSLDQNNRLATASWQASASEILLTALQGKLPANPFMPLNGWLNAELWGDWTRQDGHDIRGAAVLTEALVVNEYRELALDHFSMRFNWQFSRPGEWRLDLSELVFDDSVESWMAPSVSMARNLEDDLGLWISADELPLGIPLNLARDVMSVYDTQWPQSLPQMADGQVSNLDLVLTADWRLRYASGSVADASVGHWDRWPDIRGLNGKIELAESSGRISLFSPDLSVDWPRMFRDPLQLQMHQCELEIKWGGLWQLGFEDCHLENEDLEVVARTVIAKNEGKPSVDVNAAVLRADVGQLDPYWPRAVMKENILNWLRRGLVSGDLVSGRFQIFGDMDNWPFRDGEGRFEAVANVVGGELDFMPEWPNARQLEATARFFGASMDISGSVGDIAGVPAREVTARIEDMKSPVLEISYSAEADLPGFLGFILDSPLKEHINTDLTRFEFAGPARTTGNLRFPLGTVPGEQFVRGTASLDDGYFHDPGSEFSLSQIRGQLDYDDSGFSGRDLVGQYRGHEAMLEIDAGSDRERPFTAHMVGDFDVRDVIPGFLLDSYSAFSQIEGSTEWQVSMLVDVADDGSSLGPVLTVNSDLIGVQLDLPAPLHKEAHDELPLVLHYPLTEQERILDIELQDRVALEFELSGDGDAPRRAAILLGGGQPELPATGLIRIAGASSLLDLDGWIEVIIDDAREGKGIGGLDLEPSSLQLQQMIFLDRAFDDVALDFELVDNDVKATFAAEKIDGKVSFAEGITGLRSLTAEFERLALDQPLSSGMDMESDPADLPALHLYARSFRYAGVELGETRIEAYPSPEGFHFEKVDAVSDQLSVQANGDWSLDGDTHRSDFNINMSSESLGDFLNSMDISSAMQGGQTLVQFNAWWPGSPAAFALSRLNGEVDFSVVQGNIADASPGTGRLLGLLSVSSLPKRLSLDFRDVFDSGFSFDEANGSFRMENGQATTDDVIMTSSAAQISISGSTDLVAQQYDQVLTVRPGVGNTLPVIGAIAGGPVGVAAGLALQGLLHEQLGDATQVQYSITGSWDEPVFEPIIKNQADGP